MADPRKAPRPNLPMRKGTLIERLGRGEWIVEFRGKKFRRKVQREVRNSRPFSFVVINGQEVGVS